MPWKVPPVAAVQKPTKATVVEAGTFSVYGVPASATALLPGVAQVTATRA